MDITRGLFPEFPEWITGCQKATQEVIVVYANGEMKEERLESPIDCGTVRVGIYLCECCASKQNLW
jgi:hypothetical protein